MVYVTVIKLNDGERKCDRCHFASTDYTECYHDVLRGTGLQSAASPCSEPRMVDGILVLEYSKEKLQAMRPCPRFEISVAYEDAIIATRAGDDAEKRRPLARKRKATA